MHTPQPSIFLRSREFEVQPRQYSYEDLSHHKVAVVGLGYAGLPLAIAIAEKGYDVIGFDIDAVKINQLQSREVEFLSTTEQAVFKSEKLTLASNQNVLRGADTFFICAPTPVTDDHAPDLTPLIEATRMVAKALRHGSVVIVESSVSPGVSDDILIPVLEFESGLKVEKDFFYAYCPERINPGDNQYDTKNTPRVIGGAGPLSLEQGINIYDAIIEAPLTPMRTIKEAEAVKLVENTFRDVNIALVNELAMAFDHEGIDVINVIKAAATKPFGYMAHYPGCGVGGQHIPVDPYNLIEYGMKHGFTHHMLIAARETNSYMPFYTIKLLREALYAKGRNIQDTPIIVLGLAYKRGLGDITESPALEICDLLRKDGAPVRTFDPYVPLLSTDENIDTALEGSKAIIIATDHPEFAHLTPTVLERFGAEVVIDGRNLLDKDAFSNSSISYYGIGR